MSTRNYSSSSAIDTNKDMLNSIKDDIRVSFDCFQQNIDRFNMFMYFTFVSTLSNAEKAKLRMVDKPPMSFNIMEPYLSRLFTEFSKNTPSVIISLADGIQASKRTQSYIDLISIVEANVRHSIHDISNDDFANTIFKDIAGGGYGVGLVYNDYINDRSFMQKINFSRRDPTLCFFDPLAKESHKGDGIYCGEIFYLTDDEFKRRFGSKTNVLQYTGKSSAIVSNVRWSLQNYNEKLIMLANYFKKEFKEEKLVYLADNSQMLLKDYKKWIDYYSNGGFIEQPPAILRERKTKIEKIKRYLVCENEILSEDKTDFEYLPYVFFDGNSVRVSSGANGTYQQYTRPYNYQAYSTQKMKDFAGQTMLAELENMMMSKLIAPLEAIPPQYKDAYVNYQKSTVIPYNSFFEDNPNVPLAPPREVQRTQTPQIVAESFMLSDKNMQENLGSYDAQSGIQKQDMSGEAFKQGALQSSGASNPWIRGYMNGLTRMVQIQVDLIPKLYVTPRTIPILRDDGSRDYQVINDEFDPNSIYMNYDPKDLNIKIEPGASFGVQKQLAVEQILRTAQILPKVGVFLSDKAMPILFDNMEFRGADSMKVLYEQFLEESEQQQAQMQQMQQEKMQLENQSIIQNLQIAQQQLQLKEQEIMLLQQANQAKQAVDAANIVMKNKELESKEHIETAKVTVQNKKADADILKAMADAQLDKMGMALKSEEIDAENARTASDIMINHSKHELDIVKATQDMQKQLTKDTSNNK